MRNNGVKLSRIINLEVLCGADEINYDGVNIQCKLSKKRTGKLNRRTKK